MTHKLVKFIRMLGLGLLMMGGSSIAAKKITFHTLEAAIETAAAKCDWLTGQHHNSDIIEFFDNDPGSNELLAFHNKSYGFGVLRNISTGVEWSRIEAWFKKVTPQSKTLSEYLLASEYFRFIDVQKIIDLVENDKSLTAKIEARLYTLHAYATPNQRRIIESWYEPQIYTAETIKKHVDFCISIRMECDTGKIIEALQQDLEQFNILKKIKQHTAYKAVELEVRDVRYY